MAATLVKDGDSIILDCGSTTLQMVPWLAKRVALTVMTNSLHIMNRITSYNVCYTKLLRALSAVAPGDRLCAEITGLPKLEVTIA